MTVAAGLVAAAVVVPRLGVASHGTGCSFSYTGTAEKQCGFLFTGLPITVHGDSSATNASIHVWLTVQGTDEVIVECSAAHAGFASCDGELGVGEGVDSFVGIVPVTCHAAGRGTGVYGCTTGCASPSFGTYCEVVYPLATPSI